MHNIGQLLIIVIVSSCALRGDSLATDKKSHQDHRIRSDIYHERMQRSTIQHYADNSTAFSTEDMDQYFVDSMNAPVTHQVYQNATCIEHEDPDCIIDHNITCVGDRQYCNLTYDEYMSLLYDYIYPTVPEWILIGSHSVVFVMGLVSCLEIMQFTKHANTQDALKLNIWSQLLSFSISQNPKRKGVGAPSPSHILSLLIHLVMLWQFLNLIQNFI